MDTTDVEKCTMADIGLSIGGDKAAPIVVAVSAYLGTFAKPIENPDGGSFLFGKYLCLVCEKSLCGMSGTFQFGLASGEGKCVGCGWPVRMHHWPRDEKGNIFSSSFEFPLSYHPDNVDVKSPAI